MGERSLGDILVHHLGASLRWRNGFQQTGESPEPELEPLPTIDELRERWDAEWAVVDDWLATLSDGFVAYVHEGVPVWQMLVHAGESRHAAPSGGGGAPDRRAGRRARST